MLRYADPEGERSKLNRHKSKELWSESIRKHQYARKVHKFRSKLEWSREEQEEGGISGLELYLLTKTWRK